jgi:hypothetical protein
VQVEGSTRRNLTLENGIKVRSGKLDMKGKTYMGFQSTRFVAGAERIDHELPDRAVGAYVQESFSDHILHLDEV